VTRPVNPPGETPNVGVPVALASRMTVPEQHEWLRDFLRRHRVSRRGALVGLGAGLLLAACGLPGRAPGGVSAPAFVGRRVSFGMDPTRQLAMAAELTGKPTGTVFVDLGTDARYGHTVEAQVRHLVSTVPQQDGSIRAADQYFVHGFADRLAPGTAYHYRFRLPGDAVSQDAVFRTAPSGREAFSFTAFGDQGVDTGPGTPYGFSNDYYTAGDTRRAANPAAALVALINQRRPAFHLLAGDICYAAGDGYPVRNNAPKAPAKGFDNFDPTTWTRYFASIESSAAGTPWMFATGNHDMEALYDDNTAGGATHGYGGHAARLDLPTNGPSGCPSVYTFRYGNVGIVSLDANDLTAEILPNAGYSRGAQVAWARRTLGALRADPGIDFIVTFFHHCAYATSTGHASDGGVRAALAPLFDEFSVDLAVQGHNHSWERTNPIRAGHSGPAAPNGATVHPATDGTTYICAGSGGRPRGPWEPGETDRYRGETGTDSGTMVHSVLHVAGGGTVPETVDWSQARYLDYAMLVVDVVPGQPGTDSSMTVRTITDTGQEIDSVTLVRRASGTGQPKPTALGSWARTSSGLSVPA
jgi:hypothetical protein